MRSSLENGGNDAARSKRCGRVGVLVALLLVLAAALVTVPTAIQSEQATQSPLGRLNVVLRAVLYFDVSSGAFHMGGRGAPIPFVLAVLAVGGVFFTIWYRFINVRGLQHAVDVVRGKLDRPDHPGEVSHFQALSTALSATIGLGNLAGVAIAVVTGGPGALFWMAVFAVFGMSLKFNSCTLSQLFRTVHRDGTISGGPMVYLEAGLRHAGLPKLGKWLGVLYALLLLGATVGGGNMFQTNQAVEALVTSFDLGGGAPIVIGIALTGVVGATVFGGIRSIGAVASRVVPLMCMLYLACCLFVLIANASRVPAAVELIVTMAFSHQAAAGGAVGTLLVGIQRAAFSNEAGVGTAAIAHAAAKTDEPVREGLVAMLGPLIDTVVLCTVTGLAIVVSGAWSDGALIQSGGRGVGITIAAVASTIRWFPYVMAPCVLLFAYSTMIASCYYGERAWLYLANRYGRPGRASTVPYRVAFVAFILLGATSPMVDVVTYSDLMVLAMAVPNVVGGILLAPYVRDELDRYWNRMHGPAPPSATAEPPTVHEAG